MKKKPSKSTLKEKKRREEFLKDLAFLKEATAHPAYRQEHENFHDPMRNVLNPPQKS